MIDPTLQTTGEQTDEALILRVRDFRDESAFLTIFDRYAKQVRDALCRSTMQTSIDANDLIQKLFLKLWNKPEMFAKFSEQPLEPGKLLAMLRRAAFNIFIDECRKIKKELPLPMGAEDNFDQVLASNEIFESPQIPIEQSILRRAMEELENRDKRLIEDYIQGYTAHRDLANRHGASEEAIRKRLRRAFRQMHRHMLKRGITSSAMAAEMNIVNMNGPEWGGFPRTNIRNRRLRQTAIAVVGCLFLLFPLAKVPQVSQMLFPTEKSKRRAALMAELNTRTSNRAFTPPGNQTPSLPGSSDNSALLIDSTRSRPLVRIFLENLLPASTSGEGPFTSAGNPVLDAEGVRAQIKAWESTYLRHLLVEQLKSSEDFKPMGTNRHPAFVGDFEGGRPSLELRQFGYSLETFDIRSVAGNFISELYAMLRRAHGDIANPYVIVVYDSLPDVKKLFEEWSQMTGFCIVTIDMLPDMSLGTAEFVAVASDQRIQQQGFVFLRKILTSNGKDVWGAEKIVLMPSQPL